LKESEFLNSRLGWAKIFSHPVPKHANKFSYTLGGTLIVLGIVQGITGVILQQVYTPDPNLGGAYDSLLMITSSASLAFVRNLHYWGAQMMMAVAILHMIRVYISGSYKNPRELQWLAGVGLLVLLFGLTFSGTILKFDQEGVEALHEQQEFGEILGVVGSFFTANLAPQIPLLTRVYASHVTVIPLITIPILALHLILIRILGISSPKTNKGKLIPDTTEPFSSHVKRMIVYGIGITLITIVLSVFIPAELGMRGLEGIEITKPSWYMMWAFGLDELSGFKTIPVVGGIAIAVLAAVPIFDRGSHTDPRTRKIMIAGLIVFVSLFTILAIFGAMSGR